MYVSLNVMFTVNNTMWFKPTNQISTFLWRSKHNFVVFFGVCVKIWITPNLGKYLYSYVVCPSVRLSTACQFVFTSFSVCVCIQVVEMTSDHKTQADALSVVLSLQKTCEYHARAMDEESGYALLKRILLSPQCMIGYHVLKVGL